MKKIIFLLALFTVFFSCNGRKQKGSLNPSSAISKFADSSSEVEDSLALDTAQIRPKVTRADGTFDDFLYSFANNSKLQRQRIQFPLIFRNNNKISFIQKRFWKFDRLFYSKSFYSLLFDRESEMVVTQHFGLKQAQFEWVYMKTNKIQQYNFKRINGAWILQSISLHNIVPSENENFVEFFYHFANDSAFQRSRTHEPLIYVTNDPDDDFAILNTTMEVDQWMAWKIFLPKDVLSNINYGQSNKSNSATKILCLKGLSNGMSSTLFFRREGYRWQFYKYEDISN